MRSKPPAAYSAYVPIRTVGPPDSPFEGVLARTADGATVVLVDRDRLRDWPGWRMPAGGHVLAPMDVVRRAEGHDIVLPAVSDRLDRLLARRAGTGSGASDGEALTVAVSVLRGVVAAISEEIQAETASWWVTSEGMPVLVCGVGDGDVVRASDGVLSMLADGARDARLRGAFADLREAIASPRTLVREADRWEDTLFGLVEPEGLITEVIGPVRARPLPAAADAEIADAEEPRRPWWGGIAFAADAVLTDAASDFLHRTRARMRARPGGKTRPILWAGGLAAIVIGVGLSWPDAPAPSAAMGAETSTPAPAPVTPATESPPADAAVEAAGALAALLDARDACGDAQCRADLQEDPGAQLPGGAIDAPERTITLLDDFGGLAVLRVDAPGERSQLVTVVTTEQEWRIRDAFDVADPPA